MPLAMPVLLRFAARIGRRHFFWHLLVPIVVGAGAEAGVAALIAHANQTEFQGMSAYVFSLERAGLLAGVFLTFWLVLYYQIQKEADIGMRNVGLAVLQDALKGAKSYLAIAAIPLREWFEPATQTYFATIVQHQLATPTFWHDRVLMVFTSSDRLDLGSALMDEYHARAFIRLHALLGARLAYLEREEIFTILDGLSAADRRSIRCYRTWQTVIPDWILDLVSVSRLRRRIRTLAIALIEYDTGPPCVLLFSKSRHEIGIRRVTATDAAPFQRFCEGVKLEIFESATPGARPPVRAERDFMHYYT